MEIPNLIIDNAIREIKQLYTQYYVMDKSNPYKKIKVPNEFDEIKLYTYVGFIMNGNWIKALVTEIGPLNHNPSWIVVNTDGKYLIEKDKGMTLIWLNKNPFKSEAQRRYMWANHPEIARKWSYGK